MLRLQKLMKGGDHPPIHVPADGKAVEILRLPKGGVGEQVDPVSQLLQLPQQVLHALHGPQLQLPPGHQTVYSTVEAGR